MPEPEPESLDLIPLLDANRDYGERSYEDIVAGVKAGDLKLLPPPEWTEVPIIRTSEGQIVKGSAKNAPPGIDRAAQKLQHTLARWLLEENGDEDVLNYLKWCVNFYDEKPSRVGVEAAKVILERVLGKPKEQSIALNNELIMQLLQQGNTSRPAEVREIVYEVRRESDDE